ncbi:Protein of unknown function DUF3468 [Penicillium occitanis (nom. inval.)]|nr:hypothetical protein PENOC_100310 [Penicillium occitanis (nom. inval.)]PCG94606.1 Protein of unknown function DUF3468 [Penicillium occitanis (nom. inval.)]
MPWAYDTSSPALSEEDLESALVALDLSDQISDGQYLQVGPFTVIKPSLLPDPVPPLLSPSPPTSEPSSRPEIPYSNNDTFAFLSPRGATKKRLRHQVSKCHAYETGRLDECQEEDLGGVCVLQKEFAAPISPLPSASKEEARLFHHWVTHMSSFMIPNPTTDNPFRTVLTPLALSAQGLQKQTSGHASLWHAICAVAAFNFAQQRTLTSNEHNQRGIKHHRLSLMYLQRSLAEQGNSQPEAVLGTMILLISIDCITGNFSAWRYHIRGCRTWLLSTGNGAWRKQRTASTLYQIFLVFEALAMDAIDHDSLLKDLDPSYSYNSIFGVSGMTIGPGYQLDSLFGITPPILEAIVHINELGSRMAPPPKQEIENLRIKLLLNDPRSLTFDPITDETEKKLMRHHAYVFYFACHIHHQRVLCRAAPNTIQFLVQQALEHLEAIARLEINMNVVGLAWPVFVIACEAEGRSQRKRVSWYFGKGQRYGIQGISSAYKVLREVWRRRDEQRGEGNAHIRWQQVMTDLGFDLLLA